jgi:calcineurin-like phosphoesterase family protein
MNFKMLENINTICSSDDVLYHLGDFYLATSESKTRLTFPPEYYRDEIKPELRIIRGNHDGKRTTWSLTEEATIKVGKTKIYLSHYPRSVLDLNLCGHIHGLWTVIKPNNKYIVNVGVDVWDFKPITFDQIMQRVQKHRDFFRDPSSVGSIKDLGKR